MKRDNAASIIFFVVFIFIPNSVNLSFGMPSSIHFQCAVEFSAGKIRMVEAGRESWRILQACRRVDGAFGARIGSEVIWYPD